jgi:hypothetical protein
LALFPDVMNKWQIIFPVAAMVVVAGVLAVMSGRKHHHADVIARTQMIGQDLIAKTNSPHLLRMSPLVQKRLAEFLQSKAGVAEVKLGDEPAPIGDGTASSRLILSNAAGVRLGIRLEQDSEPERFYFLGFWTITNPAGAAYTRKGERLREP